MPGPGSTPGAISGPTVAEPRTTIPFFKLQIAGNGFVLADFTQIDEDRRIPADRWGEAARALCNRRFGVGAAGAIFLSEGNTLRAFTSRGENARNAEDALLCAARYAFDSGRVKKRAITFETATGEREVGVLGAHEFRIPCGSPFSLLGGRVITPLTAEISEIIEHDGIRTAFSALHILEDALVAFPQTLGTLDYGSLRKLSAKAFPDRRVTPVIARSLTRDTVLARVEPRGTATVCAAATAALTASVCAGIAERDAMVLFDFGGTASSPDSVLETDRDQSRRVAVSWDSDANELFVTGTGGYVYEGKFDLTLS